VHGVQHGGRAFGVSSFGVFELRAVTGSSVDRSCRTGGNLRARHVRARHVRGRQLRAGRGAIRVEARRTVSALQAGSPVEAREPLAVRPFEGQPLAVRPFEGQPFAVRRARRSD
jgi:hypothetical protein